MRTALFLLVVVLLLAIAAVRFLPRPKPAGLGLGFIGRTNGVVVPIVSHYLKRKSPDAPLGDWLAAGTNAVAFAVTNLNPFAIEIFHVANIYTTNGQRFRAPLLNAPNASGIPLLPGQVTSVQIPCYPDIGQWRLQVVYNERNPRASLKGMLDYYFGPPKKARATRTEWMDPAPCETPK